MRAAGLSAMAGWAGLCGPAATTRDRAMADPALLAFVALGATMPPQVPPADVAAVSGAMREGVSVFGACMAPCLSSVCAAYSPRTGECARRSVGHGCDKNHLVGNPGGGNCFNATHSYARGGAPAPDLRCAPARCLAELDGLPAAAGHPLVPLGAYTFNGTHAGINTTAAAAALDTGVAADLAMLRSLLGTYDNATWFLHGAGYAAYMNNPTLLPARYPRSHRLAVLLGRMPPRMFAPGATLLPAPAPAPACSALGRARPLAATGSGVPRV